MRRFRTGQRASTFEIAVAVSLTCTDETPTFASEGSEERIALDLTVQRLATPNTGPEVWARESDWAPADRIVFIAAQPDQDVVATGRLWTMSADGGDPRDITPSEIPFASEPTWTPDGTRILFGTGGISAAEGCWGC